MSGVFDRALTGAECWIRAGDGTRRALPTRRWLNSSDSADRRADTALTRECDGPTIDLGCGPGRLVATLLRRGVIALGVDISATAVAITRGRGAPALQRDLFGPLPGAGRWSYALLADGNIGIGADPDRLLRRVGELLASDGVAVIEFDRPGSGMVTQRIRVETATSAGPWFSWTRVGVEYAEPLAGAAGFRVRTTVEVAGRHIAWLDRDRTTAAAALA
ncbi:methyltransferase domain-containing protein [Nocardia sp. NPDC051911]|uniref:methyltransferase domain-containing protein n=1 Tax=Nocardia sp. NPDC051911 TaxID=3154648 RepID=UPI003426995F